MGVEKFDKKLEQNKKQVRKIYSIACGKAINKNHRNILSFTVFLFALIILAQISFATTPSTPIPRSNISAVVSNNSLTGITITGKTSGKVYIYKNSSCTSVHAITVSSKTSVTLSANPQTINFDTSIVSPVSGYLYVTYNDGTNGDSDATPVWFTLINESAPFLENDITIYNNQGFYDQITISPTVKGDTIKVYTKSNAAKKLVTTATATSDTTNIYIKQLGTTSGIVYITRTSTGCTESEPYAQVYDGESIMSQNGVPAIDPANVAKTFTNGRLASLKCSNLGLTGIITAVVAVYADSSCNTLLGSIPANGTSATITFKDSNSKNCPLDATKITDSDKNIYIRFEVLPTGGGSQINSPSTSVTLTQGNFASATITCNYKSGSLSSASVSDRNIAVGDMLYVYKSDNSTLLGSFKATALGVAIVPVKSYVNAAPGTPGTIYVHRVAKGSLLESIGVTASFDAFTSTSFGNTIVNNPSQSSDYNTNWTTFFINNSTDGAVLLIRGLQANDIINVYSDSSCSSKTIIASGVVKKGTTDICLVFGHQTASIYVTRQDVGDGKAVSSPVTIAAS